jgi:MFS family permease
MSNATIAPSLPSLAIEFSGTPSADFLVKMLLPIPTLFVIIFAPILGWMTDKFGCRNQIIISIITFSIAGVAGAQLEGLEAIIISRAILGICVAGLMTATTYLITDYFSEKNRSQFIGFQQAFSNIGSFLFIITAGYLAAISARLPFYIYAIAILLVPFVFLSIRDSKPTTQQINFQQGNAKTKWKLPLIGCSILIFCHLIVFYILPTQIPFFMADIGIADPRKSGMVIGLSVLIAAITSVFCNKLATKIQNYGVALIGFTSMSIGMFVLSQANSFDMIILGCCLISICMGFVIHNLMVKGMELVPNNKRGVASGVLSSSIFIGQFASPFVTSTIIAKLGYSEFYLLAGAFTLILALAGTTTLKMQPTSITNPNKGNYHESTGL